MTDKYNFRDFQFISWTEFQTASEKISDEIKMFCTQHNLQIDYIVPILRGGGPLSISLSHLLNISKLFPCQYKYEVFDGQYMPVEYLSTIELAKNKANDITVLVTEGNHAHGKTAKKCICKIKSVFPRAKIIYASIGRDYAYKDMLPNTIFETWGFLTNETESLNKNECEKLKVKEKFVVYPWELIEEEIMEVNNSIDCSDGGNYYDRV